MRETQIALCHAMLDSLFEGRITLCDAGVGIGKTHAYLVACLLWQIYRPAQLPRTVVISTSSVALQSAILKEYLPLLSRVLVQAGILDAPVHAIVRKGKERFVCEQRLAERFAQVLSKAHGSSQQEAALRALYANSRMLYSLAKQGNAPAYLGKLSKKGVPVGGVITSAIIIAIAVVVVFVWPEFAFNYLMSIATIAAAINWIMIMVTEIKFRRMVAAGDGPAELKGLKGKEALDKIAFKLPFANVTPYVVIAFMLLVVVLMCFSASYRIAVIAGVIWLAVLFAAYQLTQVGRKQADASAADAE